MHVATLVLLAFFALTRARKGFGEGDQDWGYVEVRDGAHIFWWLYYTTGDTNYTNHPLVVWLQGGPGVSSTGFGNFAELGPLDLDLKARNSTWIKDANVLFVDQPVGVGFSYVQNLSSLTTTNREIALDFVNMLKGFYYVHPEFQSTPFYIVSESYGGKMAIEIALVLDQAIKKGTIKSNFLGVGLGDSWIDPVTITLEYAPYLLAVGAIDQKGHDAVAKAALETKQLFDLEQYENSTFQLLETQSIISERSSSVDFYNILKRIPSWDRNESIAKLYGYEGEDKLEAIMLKVKNELKLEENWKFLNVEVSDKLMTDFMKNVTAVTKEVLETTDIKVAIYNGQLDLIVCTPGVVTWLDNLEWSRSNEWTVANRLGFSVHGIYEGYEKFAGNLGMFWVNRAGHMVPTDNPNAMDHILRWLTKDYDGTLRRKQLH